MLEKLSIDGVARLSAGKPWAVRVLAGLFAYERDPVPFEWPEAPEDVQLLACASAQRDFVSGLGMNDGHESWHEALSSKLRVCFGVDGRSCEGYAWLVEERKYPRRYVLCWDDDEVEVYLVGEEDEGSLEGRLHSFADRLVVGWLMQIEPEEEHYEGELPILDDTEPLVRFLRDAGDRRAQLAASLRADVVALEARIAEAEERGEDATTLYDEWSARGDELAAIDGKPPWPTYYLPAT